MAAKAQSKSEEHPGTLLNDDEAGRRSLMLGKLQAALADLGVQAVIGRHQRLALGSATGRFSGPTDPKLYVFALDGTTVTVTADADVYRMDDGREHPASDPAATAAAITGQHAPACA